MNQPAYFAYWGKAMPGPDDDAADAYHLLPFHSLDVAACGACLLELPRFSLDGLAADLDWSPLQAKSLFTCLLALHDLGKFARTFQSLVPDLSPDLVPSSAEKKYETRHDTLGWWLWREWVTGKQLPADLPPASPEFWGVWMRCMTGHHGRPPEESSGGGNLPASTGASFLPEDRQAALAFVQDVVKLLLPPALPLPEPGSARLFLLKKHAWRLAGLATLADWLGSDQRHFPYRSQPTPLSSYWPQALHRAERAVANAGLAAQPIRPWLRSQELFDYLDSPTPLQEHAASVGLGKGPQLFILEDVTGAGKTEAALILAQRLMQAGRAQGMYFALPSMATANQMYQRVGQMYQRMYAPEARPSLVLAHGARQLVSGFVESVVQAHEQAEDQHYGKGEHSASAQCNAWLADNRKKALLADVGVGTIDQALMAVLSVRHQSLRLLGLGGKVLVVDEVHAYDEYVMTLLRTLLTAHARQGGSAVLLSATLPLGERARLLAAWQTGLKPDEFPEPSKSPIQTELPGLPRLPNLADLAGDARYPLALQVGAQMQAHACRTRPQLQRQVQVRLMHTEDDALNLLQQQARQGRCAAWIRNTVDDARRAWQALAAQLGKDRVQLFHSRFAMGDRLKIEADVLARFGKQGGSAQRHGRVLIGTQVLEQSLDFDVDTLVSDLAPIDLIIQRAGRLHRHLRQANGDRWPESARSSDQRPAPVLHVLCPEITETPQSGWYSHLFPKADYVYPDTGRLWLSARALQQAGCIATPGQPRQIGAVRTLVEAVYGADEDAIPEGLRAIRQKEIGKGLCHKSQARLNALRLNAGYSIESSARWYEDEQVPTRLGDETQTLYLAAWRANVLHPICSKGKHAWEQSCVRVSAWLAAAPAPAWQQRFAKALATLRQQHQILEDPAFILPLEEIRCGTWQTRVQNGKGQTVTLLYDQLEGLRLA